MSDIIMAVDPSSTRTGYAVLRPSANTGRQPTLLDAGLLRPRRTKDPAVERAITMALDLERLIDQHQPGVVVVEIPSGKPGVGSRAGASSSLAVYGLAAGILLYAAMAKQNTPATPGEPAGLRTCCSIDEQTWTRGYREGRRVVGKAARAKLIALSFPGYGAVADSDRGQDAADAIGLAWWWIGQNR